MNKPSVPALAETEKGVNQVSKKERAAVSSSLGIFAVAAHGKDQSERNTTIGALDINGFAQDRLKASNAMLCWSSRQPASSAKEVTLRKISDSEGGFVQATSASNTTTQWLHINQAFIENGSVGASGRCELPIRIG